MSMHRRWFESNERAAAKKAAKERDAHAWKFTRVLREGGKLAGFYVGKELPKSLSGKNVTVEDVV